MPSVPNLSISNSNQHRSRTSLPIPFSLRRLRFGQAAKRGSDLHRDKPRPVTRQRRAVNDEPIHFPNTPGTSYRFADLRSPTVNFTKHTLQETHYMMGGTTG